MSAPNQGDRPSVPVIKATSQPIHPAPAGVRSAPGVYNQSAQQYSRNGSQYSVSAQKRTGLGKKIALSLVAVFVVLAIGGGTAAAMYMNSLDEALTANITPVEQEAIAETLKPQHSYTDPFYMLLIGSDRREMSDEDGQRSDTNILVRVDPVDATVTMISIPRDTQIEIDGYGTNKFNAAYNYGGAKSTIREANQLCGVEISHYAEVEFDKLIELIDVVGGVEVEVMEEIDDPDAGNIKIEKGKQTLNGEAALVFARSRAYIDGDFTRTSNQRLLVEALINKIMSMPMNELPGLIQSAAQCVSTDFKASELLDLALQFKDLGSLTMYSAMVPSRTETIGGVSYVIADERALQQMMKIVDAGEDPNELKLTASTNGYSIGSALDEDLDGTGVPGTGVTPNPYGYDGTGNDSTYYPEGSYVNPGYQEDTYVEPDPPYDPDYIPEEPVYTDDMSNSSQL